MRSQASALSLAALLALAACDLPRDSEGTLDRVRHGTLRVGVVPSAPWVTDSLGNLGGLEVRLVVTLAQGLGARVAWVRRPEPELLEALRARELDLVVGGLTNAEPWKSQVAFTHPYYTDTVAVGSAQGTVIRDLQSQAVGVEAGDPTAALLRKRGAVPRVVADLKDAPGAVAAPTWRLAALGRVNSGIVLRQDKHVLAAPPGENAWLVYVERFLLAERSTIPGLLRSVGEGS
jgi:polar amino acid transport system substrate-binding protein